MTPEDLSPRDAVALASKLLAESRALLGCCAGKQKLCNYHTAMAAGMNLMLDRLYGMHIGRRP